VQELQADSLTRRWDHFSVVSLRLHAVLEEAAEAQRFIDMVGPDWAVNGLFGFCTFESVADAFEKALSAPVNGHEVLWVTEETTFSDEPTEELCARYFPDVPLRSPLPGMSTFFDISRTREVLGWTPSTSPGA
jgi:UDP-glucose 4-epimerase